MKKFAINFPKIEATEKVSGGMAEVSISFGMKWEADKLPPGFSRQLLNALTDRAEQLAQEQEVK